MDADARRTPYRLVALDIDGTVLDSAQQVSAELKAALARLTSISVRTVLCTGRRWQSAAPVLRQLEHAHPVVVCTGGALIKSADDERTLHAVPMGHDAARLAVKAFRAHGLVPLLLYDRPLGAREMKIALSDQARAEGLPYLQANPGSWEWYEGGYPPGCEAPLAVYTVDGEAAISSAEPYVRAALGERGIVEVMRQLRYGADQVAIEVHDTSATKWRALEWLLEQWGVRADEVVAMGDDVNDVPMLRAAGLSFAMGNASDAVKAAADQVTASNDEHGVAVALGRVFGFHEAPGAAGVRR
jgi:hypothetical protein